MAYGLVPADALPEDFFDEEEKPVNSEEQEEKNPADSQSEEEREKEKPSQQGDNTGEESESKDSSNDDDENTPFHKRWKKREEKLNSEWQSRFEAMQARIDEMESRKSETTAATEELVIPSWFLGDEDAYKEYLAQEEMKQEKIIQSVLERERQQKEAYKRELDEYEKNYDDQLLQIEESIGKDFSDSDKNKLLNYIVNELDEDERPLMSNGLYNLKSAYKMFRSQYPENPVSDAKKKISDKTSTITPGVTIEEKVYSSRDFR